MPKLALRPTPLLAIALLIPARGYCEPPSKYQSPYSVKFTHPVEDLIGDILQGPRGNIKDQAKVPFDQWYSEKTKKRFGPWGPSAKAFAPPANLKDRSADWKRERILAIALRYQGYSYQHHHLPDWNPPADWPWKEVGHGRNAKGVDCSNFTGFVYNVGLGIHLSTAIKPQSEQCELATSSELLKFEKIEKPRSIEECRKVLRTGDLLFIKNKEDKVSHVIFWVGKIGQSSDNVSLILDSTGTGHKDSAGQAIPDGVHLRPIRATSWYYQNLSHIHRVIPDDVSGR